MEKLNVCLVVSWYDLVNSFCVMLLLPCISATSADVSVIVYSYSSDVFSIFELIYDLPHTIII